MNNDIKYFKGNHEEVFYTVYEDEEQHTVRVYWCTVDIACKIISNIIDIREIPYFGNEQTKISNYDPQLISCQTKVSKEHLRRKAKEIHALQEKRILKIANAFKSEFEDENDQNIYPKYGRNFGPSKFALMNQPMLDELIKALKQPDQRSWAEDNSNSIFKKIWNRKNYEDVVFEKNSNKDFISFTDSNKIILKNEIRKMEQNYYRKFKSYHKVLRNLESQNKLLEYILSEFDKLFNITTFVKEEFISKYNELCYLSKVFPTVQGKEAIDSFLNIDNILIPDFTYKYLRQIIYDLNLPNNDDLLMISRADDINRLAQNIKSHFIELNNLMEEENFKKEVEKKIYFELDELEIHLTRLYNYTHAFQLMENFI